jgi:hypothetical protein
MCTENDNNILFSLFKMKCRKNFIVYIQLYQVDMIFKLKLIGVCFFLAGNLQIWVCKTDLNQ